MENLKSCPKCKGRNLFPQPIFEESLRWIIVCQDCEHTGPSAESIKLASKAWNESCESTANKQIGPDVRAITLWLKKHKPEKWAEESAPTNKPKV